MAWLAGKAMEGLLASTAVGSEGALAKKAVRQADALLEELEKTTENMS